MEGAVSEVNMTHAERRVYLVKLPRPLAEALDQLPDGATVGTLVSRKTAQGVSGEIITVELGGEKPLPTEYPLKMRQATPQEHLFTLQRGTKRTRVAMEGTVAQMWTAEPSMQSAAYHRMCRVRQLDAVQPKHAVKGASIDVVTRTIGRARPTVPKPAQREKPSPQAAAPKEGEELKQYLLLMFSEKEFWSMKEIVHSTRTTESRLKPMLKKLCNFHRSGKHNGKYELKPEFKVQAAAEAE